MEKANECRRCWAQVGDWATDAGWEKSNEDMNMGALCVVQHQTQNLEYAKLKVYGEEKRAVIHKPPHYEDMLQSVFEEGYCEHAN